MNPRRPHPTGSTAKQAPLRLHKPPFESQEVADARRLAADMVFSMICDVMHHDGPDLDIPVNNELKKLAGEMFVRAGRPPSDFPESHVPR